MNFDKFEEDIRKDTHCFFYFKKNNEIFTICTIDELQECLNSSFFKERCNDVYCKIYTPDCENFPFSTYYEYTGIDVFDVFDHFFGDPFEYFDNKCEDENDKDKVYVFYWTEDNSRIDYCPKNEFTDFLGALEYEYPFIGDALNTDKLYWKEMTYQEFVESESFYISNS